MKSKEYAVPNQITSEEIRILRNSLGLNRQEFAGLLGVSVKTVEYWETKKAPVTGPLVLAAKLLKENPQIPEALELPQQDYPLRLLYMFRNEICTVLDLDVSRRLVRIKNFTDRVQFRALGNVEHPTYDQVCEFLKSRCFSEHIADLKLKLRELNLPFYDPFLIIGKTEGRMAEDDFHIRIVRK